MNISFHIEITFRRFFIAGSVVGGVLVAILLVLVVLVVCFLCYKKRNRDHYSFKTATPKTSKEEGKGCGIRECVVLCK